MLQIPSISKPAKQDETKTTPTLKFNGDLEI